MKTRLDEAQMSATSGGEAMTIAGMMAVLIIGIVAVVCYRFFVSNKGSVTLPGGFKFTWD